jgi:hypothetical protein
MHECELLHLSHSLDAEVQVDYARVVDLDVGASKSDICAIKVVTISERAGRTRACNRGLVLKQKR